MNRRDLLKSLLAVAGASVAATTMMTPEAVVAAVAGSPVALPWLPCDGRGIETATYGELFDVMRARERLRIPDGDHFVLPDLRGLATHVEIFHWRRTRAPRPAPIPVGYWIRATGGNEAIPVGTIVQVAGEPGKALGAEIAT